MINENAVKMLFLIRFKTNLKWKEISKNFKNFMLAK